jgi:hypothetical protein
MKLTEEQFKHYVKQIKLHEEKRLSTNERNEYWKQYFKNPQRGRIETSWDMSKF